MVISVFYMKNRVLIFIYVICIFGIKVSFAIDYGAKLDKCFMQASKKYNVPKEILVAIASVESRFNVSAINKNKNGSYDLGIMQINSIWFSKLAKIGIMEKSLYDPCQNIMIGAWILAQNINSYGFNWLAIQRYNGSDTQLKYAQKVKVKLEMLSPELFNKSVVIKNDKHVQMAKSKSIFLYIR